MPVMQPIRMVLFLLLCILAAPARADDPPASLSAAPLTPALASALRDLRTPSEVEAALGGPGAVVGSSEESDGPHVIHAWRDSAGGKLRLFLFRSGDFSLVMRPAAAQDDIVMNSFGAFVCPTCSPPVNACGRRPWWVPHDVHWDNFDCGCTLAGPQSVRVGRC
jgi:hypothetical protein